MLHGQIPDIPDSGWKIVPIAISLYVLGDDLFHVRGEKPLHALLVGNSDLLAELGFSKLADAVLFGAACGQLQLGQIRSGNHQTIG